MHDFLRNDISPCGYACDNNNIEILEYLLQYDYCNVISKNKLSLVHRSVINNQFDILKLLSEKYKHQLNINDRKKCTPFYYSLINFNIDIIKYLHKKCLKQIESIMEKYGSFAYIVTNNCRFIEYKKLHKVIDCLIWIFQNFRNHLNMECKTSPSSLLDKRTPIQNLCKYIRNHETGVIKETKYSNPICSNLILIIELLINIPKKEDLSIESINIITKIKGSPLEYKRKEIDKSKNKSNKKSKNKK